MKKILVALILLQLLLINDSAFGFFKKTKLDAKIIVNTENSKLMKITKKQLLKDLKVNNDFNLLNSDKNILIAVSIIDNKENKSFSGYSLVTHLFYCEDILIGSDLNSSNNYDLFKGKTKNYKILNSYYFEGKNIKELCSSTSQKLNFDLCNINKIALQKQ